MRGVYVQNLVAGFINKYSLQTSAEIRYIDLISEIGELGKEIIKSTNYGKNDFNKTPALTNEIGDCLFSLLALFHELNINADEALQKSISKYELRFTQKGDISSGI